MLIKLWSKPRKGMLYFAGWDVTATGNNPQNFNFPFYSIHHPQGDYKKISLDLNGLDQATNSLVAFDQVDEGKNFPFTVKSWQVNWEKGFTEPGSSGAPLFDKNNRIIGILSRSKHADDPCNPQPTNPNQANVSHFAVLSNGGSNLFKYLSPGSETKVMTPIVYTDGVRRSAVINKREEAGEICSNLKAGFDATTQNIEAAGGSVSFNNRTEGGIGNLTYEWEFGDSKPAFEKYDKSPTHYYYGNTDGIPYSVWLKVTDEVGNTDIAFKTAYIKVPFPSICKNGSKDLGETEVDCGGNCTPCLPDLSRGCVPNSNPDKVGKVEVFGFNKELICTDKPSISLSFRTSPYSNQANLTFRVIATDDFNTSVPSDFASFTAWNVYTFNIKKYPPKKYPYRILLEAKVVHNVSGDCSYIQKEIVINEGCSTDSPPDALCGKIAVPGTCEEMMNNNRWSTFEKADLDSWGIKQSAHIISSQQKQQNIISTNFNLMALISTSFSCYNIPLKDGAVWRAPENFASGKTFAFSFKSICRIPTSTDPNVRISDWGVSGRLNFYLSKRDLNVVAGYSEIHDVSNDFYIGYMDYRCLDDINNKTITFNFIPPDGSYSQIKILSQPTHQPLSCPGQKGRYLVSGSIINLREMSLKIANEVEKKLYLNEPLLWIGKNPLWGVPKGILLGEYVYSDENIGDHLKTKVFYSKEVVLNSGFITGGEISFTYEPNLTTHCFSGGTSTSLLKENSNTQEETTLESENVSLRPNPTTGLIDLTFNNKDLIHYKIIVLNTMGTQVLPEIECQENQYEYKISLESLPTGVYFIKILNDTESVIKKVLLNR